MNNYPDGVWEGDPKAPWNRPDPPECPECLVKLEYDWSYCPCCGNEIDWEELSKND